MNINPGSEAIQRYAASQMKGEEVIFTPEQRSAVEQAIEEVARYRAWQLVELSCRTNHVHALVTTSGSGPDKVLGDFKSYATRALRSRGWFLDQQVWTKGGSTRYVNTRKSLLAAIQYVKFQEHGEPDGTK
jgi:REP element-mobilizing transposase RayT